MQIEIPLDAEQLAKSQAKAAGFESVGEYVTNLIRNRSSLASLSRQEAVAKLRQLRAETPKFQRDAILGMVSEARAELP